MYYSMSHRIIATEDNGGVYCAVAWSVAEYASSRAELRHSLRMRSTAHPPCLCAEITHVTEVPIVSPLGNR